MEWTPLNREEIVQVIEGKGNACRVPILYHSWIYPQAFDKNKRPLVEEILSKYPMDVQMMPLYQPEVYHAPDDDRSYRWSFKDATVNAQALDHAGFIEDWDTDLDLFLTDFPDAEYRGLTKLNPPENGQYRLGKCFHFFFERFWSLRNMEDALTDFYLYPDEVHTVFQHLADFFIRMYTRGKEELHLDGIFVSDDLGTQNSTFFNTKIFYEFFAPYYKQVIDACHKLGMHFWLHTCGNVETLIPKFVELGVDVLHPIQKYTMDEKTIAQKYGDSIAIWAGFDVQQTIPYGTPEDVRREVRFMIDTYKRCDGRFMLTMGNGTTADTPVESLEALFEESLRYGVL